MNSLYQQLKAHMDANRSIPYDLRLALLAMDPVSSSPTLQDCINQQNPLSNRHLFKGDNTQLLMLLQENKWQQWLDDQGGLQLIYIDPPYNVGADFTTKDGEFAFTDKWKSDGEYLHFLADRIQQMHHLLAPTGSLYLHCDYRMSAPLRLILDGIFGRSNFRNEIIWYFTNGGGRSQKYFNRKHNTIFLYSKTASPTFNGKDAGIARNQNESTFSGYFKTDEQGRRYQEVRSNNKTYVYYVDEKKNADDVWNIPIISQRDKTERIDYPTQKPITLLERIILASSNPGDLIADFFCGSGTTLLAAEKLGRKWIGCDMGELAIQRSKLRLQQQGIEKQIGYWSFL